ncbi:23S rRNA (uracil(1939)-C(5))-methyltransferase RlmD [Candidatus Peregrinibacteria bacterium]|nr:23S rRNA (uracil(1939)-C(5))-methyltransferase RlmD [Candidatus Peregrinibacteria bacterium]
MQLKKGEIIEVDIHALAFMGGGIGKYKGGLCKSPTCCDAEKSSVGLTVFVEKTIPGDKVRASLTKIKPKFAEAKLVEIVSPSKDRIKPVCKYFGICGGCQFQFMSYEKQLEFKKQHVIDAFERIGKIFAPPVLTVIACDDPFYYRNKMEFSFGYNEKMQFALGLHLPERRYDILDVDECFLQSKRSVEIFNKVREFAIEHNWLPYQYSCNKGFLQSLFIREGKRTGEIMVNLIAAENVGNDWPENLQKDLEDFVELLKDCDSVYFSKIINQRGQRKRIEERLLHGEKTITEKMILPNGDELSFEISPQAFFQVNTLQAEKLYYEVVKMLEEGGHDVIFDLYCGTGTIGLFLARHCNQVYGIELLPEAVFAARENARKNKIFNIDFYAGDAAKIVSDLKVRPSAIVVDPPRAGLTEKLIKEINDFDPKTIVYVSCNPATLARDCQVFARYNYKVVKTVPVDMFPQTYHIENVCLLRR